MLKDGVKRNKMVTKKKVSVSKKEIIEKNLKERRFWTTHAKLMKYKSYRESTPRKRKEKLIKAIKRRKK